MQSNRSLEIKKAQQAQDRATWCLIGGSLSAALCLFAVLIFMVLGKSNAAKISTWLILPTAGIAAYGGQKGNKHAAEVRSLTTRF